MFFRKVIISDECMEWLDKANSFDVEPSKAMEMYEKRCNQIQEDVLRALTTASKEPASPDGRTEIVVEVRLARARKLDTVMVVTSVYAVVYAKNNKKKYYIILDEDRQPKKVSKVGAEIYISINGGDYFEQLKTIESRNYRISM